MRRIVYSVSTVLSCLAIVGCNFKGNTDMQRKSELNCQKWDALATKIGIPTCNEAEPVHKRTELVKNLSALPKHFNPSGENYANNKKLVENYVNQMFPKTQAKEIVSIKTLAEVLKEAGLQDHYADKGANFVAIPYYERGKESVSDLSEFKTLSGINQDSKFKIYGTKEGKIDNSEFVTGTAYVLVYKLNDGTDQKYSAIVTVPDNNSTAQVQQSAIKYPLIMYAHGGDAGISFRNMATVLQNNLGKGIVAAPSFPGEPICSITTIGGSSHNGFKRSCGDYEGKFIKPAVDSEGERSPLNNDVNAFLGLHNAIARMAISEPSKPFILISNVKNNANLQFIGNLKLEYYTDKDKLLKTSFRT